jgi:hypothetical protein
MTLADTSLDMDVLAYASDCLSHFESYTSLVPENESCPMVYDSWSCWTPTRRGHTQEQACPNFPQLGFSPNRKSVDQKGCGPEIK